MDSFCAETSAAFATVFPTVQGPCVPVASRLCSFRRRVVQRPIRQCVDGPCNIQLLPVRVDMPTFSSCAMQPGDRGHFGKKDSYRRPQPVRKLLRRRNWQCVFSRRCDGWVRNRRSGRVAAVSSGIAKFALRRFFLAAHIDRVPRRMVQLCSQKPTAIAYSTSDVERPG
jgi:hypothetical protein